MTYSRTFRLAPAVVALACSGCGTLGHKAELADSRKRIQALQAESSQLKDQAVALRSQNRDLSRRSIDDDKRIGVLQEENARLTTSISAYQQERDALAASVDQIKAQVQASADSPTRTASTSGP